MITLFVGCVLAAPAAAAECNVGVVLNSTHLLSRQIYTEWTFDAVNQRYLALYLYRAHENDTSFKAQLVVTYVQPGSAGKIYFYNISTQKYWGCCDVSNPAHSSWTFPHNGRWVQNQKDVPRVPESRDGVAIVDPPAPPGLLPPPPGITPAAPPGVPLG
jgi:hypothetical protein